MKACFLQSSKIFAECYACRSHGRQCGFAVQYSRLHFLRNFLWKTEVSLPRVLETMFADMTFSSGKCKRYTDEYRTAFPWVADERSGSESDDSDNGDSEDDESDDDDGVGLQALLAGFNQDYDEDDEHEYDEEDEDGDEKRTRKRMKTMLNENEHFGDERSSKFFPTIHRLILHAF
ncbi:hypothetical protein RvY_17366 [Ramazzottius varieornatus]|uniref:Uncharacterized protein n=1 Tax=Ramazzottius varieornatus TaxID=947166 RepID=A0A1D1W1V7_RAMVA|nr:hypothetical protein RvY_17366 [Ramazzottius varieornatus]